MKNKRLLSALDDINDEFIEAAAPKEKKKTAKIYMKIGALAACVALVVTAVAIYTQNTKLMRVSLPDIFEGGMSMEAYFAYSADGVAFWSESVVSNTTILGASMMFYMLFLSMSISSSRAGQYICFSV